MDKIVIYTDGGCRGNQHDSNIGGWGAVLQYKGREKEIYEGVRNTTNNKMELMAVIKALEVVHGNVSIPVEIRSDSTYVVKGMTEWVHGWIRKGWKKSDKKPVENQELWKKLISLSDTHNHIEYVKVKGHADNVGNNRADALANKAMDEF